MEGQELRTHVLTIKAADPEATTYDLVTDVLDTMVARGDLHEGQIELAFHEYTGQVDRILKEANAITTPPNLTRPTVQLTGKDGNAFAILGRMRQALKECNDPEVLDAFMAEATAGDYAHLLITCMEYADIS